MSCFALYLKTMTVAITLQISKESALKQGFKAWIVAIKPYLLS